MLILGELSLLYASKLFDFIQNMSRRLIEARIDVTMISKFFPSQLACILSGTVSTPSPA